MESPSALVVWLAPSATGGNQADQHHDRAARGAGKHQFDAPSGVHRAVGICIYTFTWSRKMQSIPAILLTKKTLVSGRETENVQTHGRSNAIEANPWRWQWAARHRISPAASTEYGVLYGVWSMEYGNLTRQDIF